MFNEDGNKTKSRKTANLCIVNLLCSIICCIVELYSTQNKIRERRGEEEAKNTFYFITVVFIRSRSHVPACFSCD